MSMRCWRELVSLLLACALLTGCGVHEFRSETTLHADGSVERAIYQPKQETPETAQPSELWQQTTCAGEIRGDKWSGSIRDLPIRAEPEKNLDGTAKTSVYFAAWGKFDAVSNDGFQQPRNLFGRSLAAARHHDHDLVAVLYCEIDSAANRRAYSAIHSRQNNRGSSPLGITGGFIRRAVIHDDRGLDVLGGNRAYDPSDALSFIPRRRYTQDAWTGLSPRKGVLQCAFANA